MGEDDVAELKAAFERRAESDLESEADGELGVGEALGMCVSCSPLHSGAAEGRAFTAGGFPSGFDTIAQIGATMLAQGP